jgi:multiple sugar transport system substrate-binding protein
MRKTLTFEHFIVDQRGSAMQALIDGFNARHADIVVAPRLLTEGIADDATEMFGLLPPYLGRALPDVVMVYGEFVATLADQDRIRPLDDFVAGPDGIDLCDFVPGVLETVRYRDQMWALPIEGNPYALFCNLALFEQAGIRSAPTTWGDLFQAAVTLTADTDGDGQTDRYGYTDNSFQTPLFMWQAGAELLSEDLTRAAFDSEAGAQALKYRADLQTCGPPHTHFERGDVCMKLSMVENYLSGRYQHLDYAIVPLPRGRRAANAFGGAGSTLCLAIACRDPECEHAAWRFLRWFTTQAGAMDWVRATGHVPLLRPVLESAQYQEFVARWPKLRAFIEQLGICRARPCVPEYPLLKWAINGAAHESCDDGHSCSLDEAREILHRRAAQVQAALDRRVRSRRGGKTAHIAENAQQSAVSVCRVHPRQDSLR